VYNLINIMSKQITLSRGASVRYFAIMLIVALLVACGESEETTPVPQPTAAPTAAVNAENSESTSTEGETAVVEPLPTITPTVEPLAAMVNGVPITLATYERELARYEQAQLGLGAADGVNAQQVVLQTLIEQALIEQAAATQGITLTDAQVEEKIAESVELVGGEANFQSWLEANQYTEAEFREILATQMLTAEVVNQITADVPLAVEQVRARYLQVDNETLAQQILAELNAGSEFATQAQLHSLDRITGENGGDLGYFYRGGLLIPELEQVAFDLEVNEISDIVSIVNGNGQTLYYIVQTIERDLARPLQDNQRSLLLQNRFESWLTERQNEADIVTYIEN
jgi:parvulin-like peptidyl-prolyl isomerase